MNPLPANKRFHIFNQPGVTKLRALTVVLLLVLWPLMQQSALAQAAQSATDQSSILAAYNASIYDTAVYKFSNLRPLKPLEFKTATGTATVVSLTNFPYTVGSTTLPVYLWVTPGGEVQKICRGFTSDLKLRLQQLLGLHPASPFSNFVVLEVKQADIFRPTTNPDTTTTLPCACPAPVMCGEVFPQGVDPAHVRWLADKMLSSYVISESTVIPVGYPWTRLGYTYNWRPGADKYGASEYVIKPGSTITVTQVVPYEQYCSPAP